MISDIKCLKICLKTCFRRLQMTYAPTLPRTHTHTHTHACARTDTRTHSHTDTGSAVVTRGKAKIPWVFTPAQRETVDSRCRKVVMPHKIAAWCSTKEGLLQNGQRCWRMVSKMGVFFMFPVLFRGTNALVPPLTKLVYSIRLLLGRVVSEKKRRGKGWQSCFNHVFQDDLRLAKRLMPESMSEYKKVNPNPNPNPNLINFNPNPNPNLSYTHAHR